MKNSRKKLHLSDDGFSLMELIVTMLVSTVVIAAAAGFLSAGMRYYQNADAETSLQTESQIAELFLTELFQESSDYKVIDATAYSTEVTYAFEVKRDATGATSSVVILRKDNQLWYADVSATLTDAEKVSAVVTAGRDNAFLANYVVALSVTPSTWSAAKANNDLLKLTLGFKVGDKTYTENATIALRNTQRN